MLAFRLDLKKGRPKGSRNKKVKYLAVIKMPDGSERYVYPRDLETGRTLQEVIAAKAGKDRVLIVEFGKEVHQRDRWLPALNYTEAPPPNCTEFKHVVGPSGEPTLVRVDDEKKPARVLEGQPTTDAPQDVTRLERMKKVKTPGMQVVQAPPGASHSRPQSIRNVPEKVAPEDIKLKHRVKVDPLTFTAEEVLRRINSRKRAPGVGKDILVDIPALDLNALDSYPPDLRRRILAKFGGDPATLQQKFVREPMTTLLTLGLARDNPKTGGNLISPAEEAQLTHEWYWKMRRIVQFVVQHYRGTKAYSDRVKDDERRAKRTGTAREVEGTFVSKLAREKAEGEGRQVKRQEVSKTQTKMFIDSVTAEYMGIASLSLRNAAMRYRATLNADEEPGKESRFDKKAYVRIQKDVQRAAYDDLRDKHGITHMTENEVLSLQDIDDPDLSSMAPEWLHGREANPVDLREWDEVAALGRHHFFGALATLPEPYKKIIALYYQLDMDEHHKTIEGEAGERSFTAIAKDHPRWPKLNAHGVQERDEKGKLVWVNLADKPSAYQGQFLGRLLDSAQLAFANRFKPKDWKEKKADEESADEDKRIPLSHEGKLAFRWLKLQSNLREKQALAVSDFKHMLSKEKLKTRPMAASNTRVPLMMTKEGAGARFFADLGRKRREIQARLDAARAMASKPGIAGRVVKPVTPAEEALLGRLDRLYGQVDPSRHVAEVAAYTGYKFEVAPEVIPVKTRYALGTLSRLYAQYQAVRKETPAERKKRIGVMERRLKEMAAVPGGDRDDDFHRLHALITSEIALREYVMDDEKHSKKSLTVGDFIKALDDFDFNTGRLCAALME